MKHICIEKEKLYVKHHNELNEVLKKADIPNYGSAIGKIVQVENKHHKFWVAHCDEYVTVIAYCPFCGEKL